MSRKKLLEIRKKKLLPRLASLLLGGVLVAGSMQPALISKAAEPAPEKEEVLSQETINYVYDTEMNSGWLLSLEDGPQHYLARDYYGNQPVYAQQYWSIYITVNNDYIILNDVGENRVHYRLKMNPSTNLPEVLKLSGYDYENEHNLYEPANVRIEQLENQGSFSVYKVTATSDLHYEQIHFTEIEEYEYLDGETNQWMPQDAPIENEKIIEYYGRNVEMPLSGLVFTNSFEFDYSNNMAVYIPDSAEYRKTIYLTAGYGNNYYVGTYAGEGEFTPGMIDPNEQERIPTVPYLTAVEDSENFIVRNEDGQIVEGLTVTPYIDSLFPGTNLTENPAGFYHFDMNIPGNYQVQYNGDFFNMVVEMPTAGVVDVLPTAEVLSTGEHFAHPATYVYGQAAKHYFVCMKTGRVSGDLLKDENGDVKKFLQYSENPDLSESDRCVLYALDDIHVTALADVGDYHVYELSVDAEFKKRGYIQFIYKYVYGDNYVASTNQYYYLQPTNSAGEYLNEGIPYTTDYAAHRHVTSKMEAQEATYQAEGNTVYYFCSCGKFFADAQAQREIEPYSWVIPKLTGGQQSPSGSNDALHPGNSSQNTESTANGQSGNGSNTSAQSGNANDTSNQSGSTVASPQRVGSQFASAAKTANFKVTSAAESKAEVAYVKNTNKKAKKITVPNTVTDANRVSYKVTTVSKEAFKGASKATSITLGKNITKIEANVFKGCNKLKTITIQSKNLTAKNINKNAFKGVGKKVTIKVPKGKEKAYKKLFCKKGLSSSVKVKS